MNTISFMKSTKHNEKRRALIPDDIGKIKNKAFVYMVSGYGDVLGYTDREYEQAGVNVTTKDIALKQDIICDPKVGDADYLGELRNQMLFGYVHAVQNKEVTDLMVENALSAVAWEDMNEDGRHLFWRNNELAGEAAMMHAFSLYGKLPYECKAAVIGRGNTSRGAYRILASLGADIKVYNRKMEALLRKEISGFDVIVNCVAWDTARDDHILYTEDLTNMKRQAMIVDVSCDHNGAIESSRPTSFDQPVYYTEGVLHYAVDHTPSIFYQTGSKSFSNVIVDYIDLLIEDTWEENKTLQDAFIVDKGVILDQRIADYQKSEPMAVKS
ncbi:N5-(carboxyethyl)ornithine synthase [Alkalibacterium subtropicum]|uniref:N5-(Carboxyethyl)ornithine synthase n=1 Tax=Alkalibacterium subtropicum TaxID=753702 RepID=A0A1I1GMU3_9LACT|nr:N(5)-(carboxyethyl)ornithine synthase [Alkalibacterium subtropicum]SFC10440.1 N5-(carboxyethyl)ornithine synthase [Alkalibacterium subtropicum]